MNHSIHSADRSTHLKIVVVALVAGIAVAAFGISARTNADFTQTAQAPRDQGGQAGGRHQFGYLDGPLKPHRCSAIQNGRLRAAFLLARFCGSCVS